MNKIKICKKFISVIISLAVVAATIFSTAMSAAAEGMTAYYNGSSLYTDGTNLTTVTDNASITQIIVESGVTSIGDSAFRDCTGLTSVTIPDGVTSIGNWAFEDCTGLTSITIPDGVTSIGVAAFYDCTGLTSVTIPGSVTSIGNWAFEDCPGLTSVTIPDGVTSIGDWAFAGCIGLKNFNVDATSSDYEAINGVLFNKTGTTLLVYPNAKGSSYTIPSSVTSIGKWAFDGCTGLTDVTMPSSITSIEDGAFDGCTGLTNVTFPSSVTSIGDSAFDDCTGLTSVTFPSSVTSIGNAAFDACASLTSVTIPGSVTSIGSNTFNDCSSLCAAYFISSATSSLGNDAFADTNSNFKVYYNIDYASSFTLSSGNWNGYNTQEYCNLAFNSEGGNSVATKMVNYTATASEPATPSYSGKTFAGWYKDAGFTQRWDFSADTVTANTTLYAHWLAQSTGSNSPGPQAYIITYNLSGGINSINNPGEYIYGTGLTLSNPTRTGYTFGGWYSDPSFSAASCVTNISATQSGNVTLYAEWTTATTTPTVTEGVSYAVHVQRLGWQKPVADGAEAGTTGRALRIEGIQIKLAGDAPSGASISYQAYIQKIGWQAAVSDGTLAGTTGKSLRLEALRITLSGLTGYEVQYCVHVQNIGWMNWVTTANGTNISDAAVAGTTGKALRVEAIEIKIVKES